MSPRVIRFCSRVTHNAILYTETELVAEVGSADEDHGDWRTSDNVHLNPGLRLQTLRTRCKNLFTQIHSCISGRKIESNNNVMLL